MGDKDCTVRSEGDGPLPVGSVPEQPGTPADFYRPGDLVGSDYRILELIGRGGMGTVFRVEHTLMHAVYALKILQSELVNDSTWMRFQTEAKVLSRLSHPAIVQIYNMGVDRERCPYFVMELIEGEPLSEVIAGYNPLPPSLVATIFAPVAGALAFSHKAGVIHRDIKPSNVMLLRDAKNFTGAKIVDFGIAKTEHLTSAAGQSLTTTGEIFGTPYYMSPERIAGNQNDPRSDIYSLGCSIFEALTGQPPYKGESLLDTLSMHQNAPVPSLSSVNQDGNYSPRWEAFVARALAKNPAARFESMDEMAERLKQLSDGSFPIEVAVLDAQSRPARPRTTGNTTARGTDTTQSKLPRPPVFPPWVVAALAAVLIIAAGAIASMLYRPGHLQKAEKIDRPPAEKPKSTDIAKEEDIFKDIKHYSLGPSADRKHRRFHFPERTSIGTVCEDGAGGLYHQARGNLTVPDNGNLGFRLLSDFVGVSELSKFRPDDFAYLRANPQNISELVAQVTGWTKLNSVWIGSCVVSSTADLHALDKLSRLKELRLDHCSLPGEQFKTLSILKRLRLLHLESVTDNTLGTRNIDVLLAPVREWQSLKDLDIDRCQFSHQAVKSIAASGSICTLSFRRLLDTIIEDEDILSLSTMKSLDSLYLGSSRLSPGAIDYFSRFKKLKMLTIEHQMWKPEVLKKLRASLPHTQFSYLPKPQEDTEREDIRNALMRPHR